MQFIRLISFLALFINSGFFAFIFLKKSLAFINFWSLILSTVSFGCLFIGSGMQVCEQQLIRQGKKIEAKQKSRLWIWGLFFYNQALPFALTSLILFQTPTFHVEEDFKQITNIFYTKNGAHETTSYRWFVILISHYLPIAAFSIDIMINKIRIPWHHIIFTLGSTLLYTLLTYIYQIAMNDEAIYLHSLNWNCEKDWSYLQTKDSFKTISDAEPFQCGHRPQNNGDASKACRPLYTSYFCQDKFVPNEFTLEEDLSIKQT